MFVEYKKKFFFNFYFLAQIQGAPKSNNKKKKLTHGRQFISRSLSPKQKKSNGFLRRKVAYVTIYHI